MPGGVCVECESRKLIILAFLHLNSRGKFRCLMKALSYNFLPRSNPRKEKRGSS
jgi:hypothetical protein